METLKSGVEKTNIFLRILYYFLPYSLIFYSFASDAILGVNMYWPAPLLAFLAAMINTGISKALTGNEFDESDQCGIPGLSRVFPSFFAPQLILFSGTILSYIASFNTAIKSESSTLPFVSTLAPWIFFLAVMILQTYSLYKADCFKAYYYQYWWVSVLIAIAAALAIGGGTGAGFASLSFFNRAAALPPSMYGPGGTQRCPDGLPPGPNGSCDRSSGFTSSKDPNVGTCSPPNDQDQFVCEAYKNGELVTTTITESFIGK